MEDYKKKYEETLSRMRSFIQRWNGIEATDSELVLQELREKFPELKESEDKKIKKSLIRHLKECRNNTRSEIMLGEYAKWIAWLEKQDPKKHEEELENAYKCADEVQYRRGYEDAKREFEKQGKQTSDKIVEKARTEKQRILLTETDGSANIAWDCRSLDDVEKLLNCGLNFIHNIKENKQIIPGTRFGGCPVYVPTRYDKFEKQGEQNPTWSEEDKEMAECVLISLNFFENLGKDVTGHPHSNYFEVKHKIYPNSVRNWLISLKQRMKGETK